MIEIFAEKEQMLTDELLKIKGMTFGKILSLLKNKDIKVNDVKVKENKLVKVNDKITIYGFSLTPKNTLPVVFQDKNVIIVNKPAGMQVQKCDVLDNKFCVQDYFDAIPVHRLDRNTRGLLILAKNKEVEKNLISAFKNNQVLKFYRALVFGKFNFEHLLSTAYLTKNTKTGISVIKETPSKNSMKIITEFFKEKEYKNFTQLKIRLHTGKMHQIRAHLNFLNHSVVGDTKYQTKNYAEINKNLIKIVKNQCLVAYKLQFCISQDNPMCYLNNLNLELDENFDYAFLQA